MTRSAVSLIHSFALLFAVSAGTFLTPHAQAQIYTVVYNFTGSADGGEPSAALIHDSQGNLYGTTFGGGDLNCSTTQLGCGVVFRIDQAGHEKTLYKFHGGRDGAAPMGGVVSDPQGNLYGTTSRGGYSNCTGFVGEGCGTIFKIDASGKESILYRFKGSIDGARPSGDLYRDAAGNLWGTTQYGGSDSACFGRGCGVLFRLTANGVLQSHPFLGVPDGATPLAGVIADEHGNLFGSTSAGGSQNAGTIYKVSPQGARTTVYEFQLNGVDGSSPSGLLLSGGKLYGPAFGGGSNGTGAVFELSASGESVLYSFGITNGDVYGAIGTLARDSAGNLHGVTAFEPGGLGAIYKLDGQGNFTVLHEFFGFPVDGQFPQAGLMKDAQGNIWGTTFSGGTVGPGTIFKLTP